MAQKKPNTTKNNEKKVNCRYSMDYDDHSWIKGSVGKVFFVKCQDCLTTVTYGRADPTKRFNSGY